MADIERTFVPGAQTGFPTSNLYEYIIPASGSIAPNGTVVNFGRPYAAIAVTCNDASMIPSRALKARVARSAAGTVMPLWKANGEAEWVSGTLPTSGGFTFVLTHGFYVQKVQFEFNGTLTAGGTLFVSGYEPGIA